MNRRTISMKFMFAAVLIQLVAISQVFSQAVQSGDKNHNEQVTIIGSFDPSINEAYKVNQKPEEYSFSFTNPEFEFNHIDRQSDTRITLEPITPANINVDKREKISKNLLLAGFGSQFSPYLNFFQVVKGASIALQMKSIICQLLKIYLTIQARIPIPGPILISTNLLMITSSIWAFNTNITPTGITATCRPIILPLPSMKRG